MTHSLKIYVNYQPIKKERKIMALVMEYNTHN